MVRYLSYFILMMTLFLAYCESRPQTFPTKEEINLLQNLELEDLLNSYYELPQTPRAGLPYDNLNFVVPQYNQKSNPKTQSWNMPYDYYRLPETKRQARYRQCYFNPISCFKK